MKILRNDLSCSDLIRTQANYPIEGVEFIDITPLIIQKDALCEIVDKFYEELKDKDIDYLVLPEARGFLIGTPIARKLGVNIIPVRKKGKLPSNYVAKTFSYEKEYGKDVLELPTLVGDETYENKNYYIIDDIYATGNTIKAIKDVLEELGGTCVGAGVIMNIANLNNDKEVFSLIEIEEE